MSWIITGAQPFPAVIGEPFGGGYFAGYISHTQDGNPTHALIVAPRESGATGTGYPATSTLQWKTSRTQTAGAFTTFDGRLNTDLIVAAGINDHPAAKYCIELNIGGFNDWYLPSQDELGIAYFNFKPNTVNNATNSGANPYAVPPRADNYTQTLPSQTQIALFSTGGPQAFTTEIHWSSGQPATVTNAFDTSFNSGMVAQRFKDGAYSVRAFRRIAL